MKNTTNISKQPTLKSIYFREPTVDKNKLEIKVSINKQIKERSCSFIYRKFETSSM